MTVNFMAVKIITTVVGSFFDIVLVSKRWFKLIADGVTVIASSLSMTHIAEPFILAGLLAVVLHKIDGVIKAAEGK